MRTSVLTRREAIGHLAISGTVMLAKSQRLVADESPAERIPAHLSQYKDLFLKEMTLCRLNRTTCIRHILV